ncbi:hypothetical protein METHB2_750002 [Candidatus Methylobacter favarea]|uniref:Type III restriction enzyme C-terminal endonuclease domain-containing protein n=1 Tax=Candidatus Methylobacter favarea TaxID=2707345 RepID=A0A8S0XV42_9GAMM|nr:hypothetical protein METHB2_750002 [Candidatus Methylobacter favarea]
MIKLFFKLPRSFKVPTFKGNYIPDSAVVLRNDRDECFIAETKVFLDRQRLRVLEGMKIACGEKQFALFRLQG